MRHINKCTSYVISPLSFIGTKLNYPLYTMLSTQLTQYATKEDSLLAIDFTRLVGEVTISITAANMLNLTIIMSEPHNAMFNLTILETYHYETLLTMLAVECSYLR